MKYFIVLFALTATALSSIEAQKRLSCSYNDYKPVPVIPLLGKWIAYQTYNNGPQKNYKCSFYEMAKNDHLNIVWRSQIWEDDSKSCVKGFLTYTNPDFAEIYVIWSDFVDMPIAIANTDFASYFIARACLDNEEYVWILTKSANPSEETLKLIDAGIIEQGLDKSKLHRTCVGFEDSELVTYF